MKFITLILSCLLSFTAVAEEKTLGEKAKDVIDQTEEVLQDAKEKASAALTSSEEMRANHKYFALANYSMFDLLIPSKYGATFGVIQTTRESWELEYLRSSLSFGVVVADIGEMTDQRLSLSRRQYMNRSLYIGYGLSYFKFDAHLGTNLLDSVGGNVPSVDIIEIESLGGHFAIGTTWHFKKNLTLNVEWLSWAQPIFQLRKEAPFLDSSNDGDDRHTVSKAMNVAAYFPRFSFLKLQFGFLF